MAPTFPLYGVVLCRVGVLTTQKTGMIVLQTILTEPRVIIGNVLFSLFIEVEDQIHHSPSTGGGRSGDIFHHNKSVDCSVLSECLDK